MKSLAIIIPAYKEIYLRDTLDSLVNQTSKSFVVYIGDDHSPAELKSIVDEYTELLPIVYKRFDDNIGGKSLVAQWKRCLEMTDAEYIWLFSDDDILPSDAVERFWNFEESYRGQFDICRLPLELIDRKGNPLLQLENYPNHMSSEDYLKKRLSCEILSSASEYIFTRETYKKHGFVDFPLAWCSDDASWAQMAKEKGLYTIEGLPVQFRMSGNNISSCDNNYIEKFCANLSFIEWINSNFDIPEFFLYNYLRTKVWSNISIRNRWKVWKLKYITAYHRLLLIINNKYVYKLSKYV